MDINGDILCVLEAQKENLDSPNETEQACGYAENIRLGFSMSREHDG